MDLPLLRAVGHSDSAGQYTSDPKYISHTAPRAPVRDRGSLGEMVAPAGACELISVELMCAPGIICGL
jgi:hypothetical protein